MQVRQTLFDAFNIRSGEGPAIALLGGYSFLAGVFQAYYISLANASFLAEFGVDYLPRGYLVTGAVGYLVGFWLSRLRRRGQAPVWCFLASQTTREIPTSLHAFSP